MRSESRERVSVATSARTDFPSAIAESACKGIPYTVPIGSDPFDAPIGSDPWCDANFDQSSIALRRLIWRLLSDTFTTVMMSRSFIGLVLASTVGLTPLEEPESAEQRSPRSIAEELLAADRAHSAAARGMTAADAVGSFVTADVIVPAPGGVFLRGRDSLLAQMHANPDNRGAQLAWAPYRVGVSADGTHGFTYGWMTLTRKDSSRVPMKYLTYWIKGPSGWKAAAFKRAARANAPTPDTLLPPVLPSASIGATSDEAIIARHARSLAAAEKSFSDLAGSVGLGEAFRRNADTEAMNMGGPQNATFLLGPDEIGRGVGGGDTSPSTITWAADERVLVASSGDLGVSVGWINIPPRAATATSPAAPGGRVPFFTVWLRRGAQDPWRFIAE
jgi:hypothetical protein